jgi:hypothetical protein
MRDTLVPGASHPTITSDACPGRIPVAENRVESCHIAVSLYDMAISTATCTTSCRTLTIRIHVSRSRHIMASLRKAWLSKADFCNCTLIWNLRQNGSWEGSFTVGALRRILPPGDKMWRDGKGFHLNQWSDTFLRPSSRRTAPSGTLFSKTNGPSLHRPTTIAHLDKPLRQHVLQEAADELFGGKGAGSEIAGRGDRDQEVTHGQERSCCFFNHYYALPF